MQLTLSVDTAAGQRRIDIIVESLADLDRVLKRFNTYLRKRTQERFDAEGPGWSKLAPETLERREARIEIASNRVRALAEHRLRQKLRRELRRAQSKFSGAAVLRRMEVLKEFERLVAGGQAAPVVLSGEDREKVFKKLQGRLARAQGKASSKVLGRIASSITSKVSKGVLVVRSKIPWAGAQNEGAVVGHGAVLPARTFLTIEEADLDVLVELLLEYLTIVL